MVAVRHRWIDHRPSRRTPMGVVAAVTRADALGRNNQAENTIALVGGIPIYEASPPASFGATRGRRLPQLTLGTNPMSNWMQRLVWLPAGDPQIPTHSKCSTAGMPA